VKGGVRSEERGERGDGRGERRKGDLALRWKDEG